MANKEYETAWQKEPDNTELTEMARMVSLSYANKKDESTKPSVEVEEQWKKFTVKHPVSDVSQGWRRWSIAASLLLLCGIALAIGWSYIKEWSATTPKLNVEQIEQPNEDEFSENSSTLFFRNANLKSILQEIVKRQEARLDYRCENDIFLYVELEKSWTLKQLVDFLNHCDRVNLILTEDNIVVAR